MLSVKNLQVFYGNMQAIWNISFDVPEGKIVALIGGNGAGKTTTLKTIAGLLKVKSGSIMFNKINIDNASSVDIVNKGIVLVPEGRRLFPDMTVYDNLMMGAYSTPMVGRKERLQNIYNRFPRIKERLNQMAGTLSGGEQQMVAIGRGLMANPKILMLDEPSLGLAPIMVDEVFKTIKDINLSGVTVLLVEQNTINTLKIANHAYVIESGKTILSGLGIELLNNESVKQAYLGI